MNGALPRDGFSLRLAKRMSFRVPLCSAQHMLGDEPNRPAVRIIATELVGALCLALVVSHPVEGPACVALGASAFDSHDIAVRRMGLELITHVLHEASLVLRSHQRGASTNMAQQRIESHGAAAGSQDGGEGGHELAPQPAPNLCVAHVAGRPLTEGRPHQDPEGSVVGGTAHGAWACELRCAIRQRAVREALLRLNHWQPGTRWMAVHALTRFAESGDIDAERELLPRLIDKLHDDMGFPGIGLAASEAIEALYGGGSHAQHRATLSALMDAVRALGTQQHDTKSHDATSHDAGHRLVGSKPWLVRLLVLRMVRRLANCQPDGRWPDGGKGDHAEMVVVVQQQLDELTRLTAPADGDDCANWLTPAVEHAAEAGDAKAGHAEATRRCTRRMLDAMLNRSLNLQARWEAMLRLSLLLEEDMEPRDAAEDHVKANARLSAEARAEARAEVRAVALQAIEVGGASVEDTQSRHCAMNLLTRLQPTLVPRWGVCARWAPGVDDAVDADVVAALAGRLADPIDVMRLQGGERLVDLASAVSAKGESTITHVLLSALLEPRDGEIYTRFSAASALRRLAARCSNYAAAAAVPPALHRLPQEGPAAMAVVEELRRAFSRCHSENGEEAGEKEGKRENGEAESEVEGKRGHSSASVAVTAAGAQSFAQGATLASGFDATLDAAEGRVGAAHCLARMRTYPPSVRRRALADFRASKSCELSDESRMRRRGMVLLRQMVDDATRRSTLQTVARLAANESGSTKEASHYGRITHSTSPIHLLREAIHEAAPSMRPTLDTLFQRLDLPTLRHVSAVEERARRASLRIEQLVSIESATEEVQAAQHVRRPNASSGAAPRARAQLRVQQPRAQQPHAQFLETTTLDPSVQASLCTHKESSWPTCGSDWHLDGGPRGYKLWLLLDRASTLDARVARQLSSAGFGPLGSVDEHSSIVVVPHDNADALCRRAQRLWVDGALAQTEEGQQEHLHRQPVQIHAGLLDDEALEAAGCVVDARPGDALLFFPGIFHKTQDILAERISVLAEAV